MDLVTVGENLWAHEEEKRRQSCCDGDDDDNGDYGAEQAVLYFDLEPEVASSEEAEKEVLELETISANHQKKTAENSSHAESAALALAGNNNMISPCVDQIDTAAHQPETEIEAELASQADGSTIVANQHVDLEGLPATDGRRWAGLSFHNLSYEVSTRSIKSCRSQKRLILDDVSGLMLPGLNAIMGPTGSGKTTLSREGNRVVIMSIHQPRYSIFKLFDSLTLLSKGQLVYHGPALATLEYFERLGFKCEEHENPADYFLDVMIREEKENGEEQREGGNLVQRYLLSQERIATADELDSLLKQVEAGEGRKMTGMTKKCFGAKEIGHATHFHWQLFVLIIRSLQDLIRNPATSIVQFISVMFLSFIIGLIYLQLGLSPLGFRDRLGALFFVAISQSFNTQQTATDLFINQRRYFLHERAGGYYRVSAYFFSKVFTDVLLMRLIPNILYSIITYFLLGLRLEVDKFFIYFLIVHLASLTAVSLSFAVSAFAKVYVLANLITTLSIVLSLLFGGLLVALNSLPSWIGWMKYISFIRYATEGLAINEIDGLIFNGTNSSGDCAQNPCIIAGSDQLTELGYEITWLWYDVTALIGFILFFLSLAYIGLYMIKK